MSSVPASAASDRATQKRSTKQTLPCVHCGEKTICDADQDPDEVFCCNGCRHAYELIHSWGLDQYYALRDERFAVPASDVTDSRFEQFDDDEYLGRSAPTELGDGTVSTKLNVAGLHCAACVWLIESAAANTSGWNFARAKLNDRTLQLVFNPAEIKLSQIAAMLARIGYVLRPLSKDASDPFRDENRRQLVQIAIAGFCAANAMWIAIALYAGDAYGVLPSHRLFLRLSGMVLGIAAVAFPGRVFFQTAIASLKLRRPHMDLPVALGLSVGTIVGTVNAILDTGDVYFDSLTVLVFLLLVGRWIQFRQQHHAASKVDLMASITPQHARRVRDGGETQSISVELLQKDEVVRVLVGESLPVDGVVERGESTIDTSLLTGESRPTAVSAGDDVTAGTVNLARSIDVRVTAFGDDSRIGKVMSSVEDALAHRTPIIQLADRVGGWFVVTVTILAALSFAIWFSSGIDRAVSTATSLLIVACPCALALATPLAIAVSLSRAARHRVLIRDGGIFQRLSRPGTIWFDKTGTLTQGMARAELVFGDEQALGLAAAVEQDSVHPIAEAIRRCAADRCDFLPQASDCESIEGGVRGQVDGAVVSVGNANAMRDAGVTVRAAAQEAISQCLRRGATPVLVARSEEVIGVVEVVDAPKADARESIDRIRRAGWRVGILSGDHPEVVKGVADRLGIESEGAFGGMTPEEKLAKVADDPGTTVMVGDGANDAGALAASDVGIAVRGGAEVSLRAAPVFVSSGKLLDVAAVISNAPRTRNLIVTTFAVSLAYNAIAVALALAGYISPILAAVLMPISSVSVIAVTLVWPTYVAPEPADSVSKEAP